VEERRLIFIARFLIDHGALFMAKTPTMRSLQTRGVGDVMVHAWRR
jgi:hypothetical protein